MKRAKQRFEPRVAAAARERLVAMSQAASLSAVSFLRMAGALDDLRRAWRPVIDALHRRWLAAHHKAELVMSRAARRDEAAQ